MTTIKRLPVPAAPSLVRADILGQFEKIDGRRCVLAAMEGARYGRRVVGELYVAGGYPYVDVAWEPDWYKAIIAGEGLKRRPWPAGCVWIEQTPAE
jgi:hypothetical protein